MNSVKAFLSDLRSGRYKHDLFEVHNITTMQEEIRHRFSDADFPWAVHCVSILTNRNRSRQLRQYINVLFDKYPDPYQMSIGSAVDIADMIHKGGGGLNHRKASSLILASKDFLEGKDYREIQGLGVYGPIAYEMFVLDRMPKKAPGDTVLRRLWIAYQDYSHKLH